MGYSTKIATCCYCGTRAALILNKARHELACSSCGAPLHDMKRLPSDKREGKPFNAGNFLGNKDFTDGRSYERFQKPRRKHKKKRKGLMRHFIEEAFDVIEDIFD